MKSLSFKWFSTVIVGAFLAGSLSSAADGDRGSLTGAFGFSAQAQAPTTTPTSQPQLTPKAAPAKSVPQPANTLPVQAAPTKPSPSPRQTFQPPSSEVDAARTGGRAGGGSFGAPSAPSSGGSRSSGGGYSNPGGSYPSYPSRRPSYSGGGPVIVPVPVGPPPVYYPPGGGYGGYGGYGGGYSSPYPTTTVVSNGSGIVGLIILLLLAAVGLPMIMTFIRTLQRGSTGGISRQGQELYNDILTVSRVQVALLAQARTIQADLNQLADQISTDTPEGLLQLMQESALALLRSPENWSHASASSTVVKGFEKANALFSQLSVAERRKYMVETLSNVGGRRARKSYTADPDQGPASYIVITLLVGTAHDNPLFKSVHSVQELQQILEKLAAIPAEYLKVFEIIWTPQDPADTLSYDDLLAQYPDMIQL